MTDSSDLKQVRPGLRVIRTTTLYFLVFLARNCVVGTRIPSPTVAEGKLKFDSAYAVLLRLSVARQRRSARCFFARPSFWVVAELALALWLILVSILVIRSNMLTQVPLSCQRAKLENS